ncbi:MAG: hypothetical protein EOO40_01025, partial [Deltaproteobacteria bacterium]
MSHKASRRHAGLATSSSTPPVRPALQRDSLVRFGRSVAEQGRVYAAPMLCGSAIAGTAGAVARMTLTPYLLQLTAPSGAGLLAALPVLGPALSAMIGSSIFASVASACLLATVVGTLTAPRQHGAVLLPWALAHAAMGFALSPMLVTGVSGALVPAALVVGCYGGPVRGDGESPGGRARHLDRRHRRHHLVA